MAYAVINNFAAGEKEHYDATAAQVHPPTGLPDGQTHHFAGPTADGWTVIAIWDSKESWDRFRDETLLPGLQNVGDEGFPNPPEVIEYEIDTLMTG